MWLSLPTVQVRAEPPAGDGPARSSGSPAHPAPPHGDPISLPPGFQEFNLNHFIVTGASIGMVAGKFAIGPLPRRRRGGILADESARSSWRLGTELQRRAIRDASDLLLSGVVSYPFFEAVVIAGWYRRSPEVASQMALINAEAAAVTGALQAIANVIGSRERPYGRLCGTERPAEGRDCDSQDRYFSFFSGHTSQAFVSAALVCTHNAYLPLYGSGPGGVVACGSAMLVAAATGAMRILGDQHYLSDVATGAIVGTTIGLVLPRLLHYGWDTNRRRVAPDLGSIEIRVAPLPSGIWVLGWF